MKRMMILTTVLAVAIAGVALAAGGNKTTKYVLDASNTAPTSTTAGIPLNNESGECLKSVSVTLMDYSDGGADENFPWLADGLAWVEHDGMAYPDGGGKWTRAPQFDLAFDAGTSAGAPTAGTNFPGITMNIPTISAGGNLPCLPGGPRGGRFYIQTKNLLGHDAGAAFPHVILLQGRY